MTFLPIRRGLFSAYHLHIESKVSSTFIPRSFNFISMRFFGSRTEVQFNNNKWKYRIAVGGAMSSFAASCLYKNFSKKSSKAIGDASLQEEDDPPKFAFDVNEQARGI
jgi:hypothetical protein